MPKGQAAGQPAPEAPKSGKPATVNAKGALSIYRQVKAERDQGKK